MSLGLVSMLTDDVCSRRVQFRSTAQLHEHYQYGHQNPRPCPTTATQKSKTIRIPGSLEDSVLFSSLVDVQFRFANRGY